MRPLSHEEIQRIATILLTKHGSLNASLTVTSKGGGMDMGRLQTTLTTPQKTPTGLGKSTRGNNVRPKE